MCADILRWTNSLTIHEMNNVMIIPYPIKDNKTCYIVFLDIKCCVYLSLGKAAEGTIISEGT